MNDDHMHRTAQNVPPRVLLDTTVLCAAIRNPSGVSMKLLGQGLLGLYEPVVTEEIVAEWQRNCRIGLGHGVGRVAFEDSDLDAFCRAIEPILTAEMVARVRIGRAESPAYPIRQVGSVTIIQVPGGSKEASSRIIDEVTLAIKDIGDFHVVEAALVERCDYLCTANTRDFPDGLLLAGRVEVIRPGRLFDRLTKM